MITSIVWYRGHLGQLDVIIQHILKLTVNISFLIK